MDDFQKDIEAVVKKHKISGVIVMYQKESKDYIEGGSFAMGQDEDHKECEMADLFLKCVKRSKTMKGIVEHAAFHTINSVIMESEQLMTHPHRKVAES